MFVEPLEVAHQKKVDNKSNRKSDNMKLRNVISKIKYDETKKNRKEHSEL